jgi:hypothetical protein
MGVVGGGIALFNAKKAVLWKRAELANTHLRELTSNEDWVFACRALDWNGGLLVVPEKLRPLLAGDKKNIVHNMLILIKAVDPHLLLSDLEKDERLQIYRTAVDTLLSWLAVIESGLERELFVAKDLDEVGYWVLHIQNYNELDGFIKEFGYMESMLKLRNSFSYKAVSYRRGRLLRSDPRTIEQADLPSPAKDRAEVEEEAEE